MPNFREVEAQGPDESGPLTIETPWEPSASCPVSDDGHCAHSTGIGIAYGNGGGYDTYRCCHCGREAYVQWRSVRRAVPGHGPYFGPSDRVHEWPQGWRAP